MLLGSGFREPRRSVKCNHLLFTRGAVGAPGFPLFPFLETSRLLQRPEWRGTSSRGLEAMVPRIRELSSGHRERSKGWAGSRSPAGSGQMVFSGNCLRGPCRFLHSVSPILTSAHSASSVRADSGGPKTEAGRILGASVGKIGKESTWSRSPDLDTQDTQRIYESLVSLDFFEAVLGREAASGARWGCPLPRNSDIWEEGRVSSLLKWTTLHLSARRLICWLPHLEGSILLTAPG